MAQPRAGFKPATHLQPFNSAVLLASVAIYGVLGIVALSLGPASGWLLLAIPPDAFAIGALAGFLLSIFGDEEKRFDPVLGLLNGLLGGFAIGDLTKDESLVRLVLRNLASTVGLPGATGVIGLMFMAFAAGGFLLLYDNKKLLLNPLQAEADEYLRRLEGIMNAELAKQPSEPDQKPTPGVEAIAAASFVLSGPVPDQPTVEALRRTGKAAFLSGDAQRAEGALHAVLAADPTDVESLGLVAQLLLQQGREVEAVPLLERLVTTARHPDWALKLLGYAYLYEPSGQTKSLAATSAYLAKYPEDEGAKLKKFCAYGQLGPIPIAIASSSRASAISFGGIRSWGEGSLTLPVTGRTSPDGRTIRAFLPS